MTSAPGAGNGGDDDASEDTDASDRESFAELMGDARPIERGPARIEPARSRAATSRRETVRGARAAGRRGARFHWPDPDDRHRARVEGVNEATLRALGRGEPGPQERIDLHGVRRDAANKLLADRIAAARARGLRCVIVIHGRGRNSPGGEAVLRDALPDWLSHGPCSDHVLAFSPAPRGLGDVGATLVLLRS